jgi:hypothetical protein
VRFVATALLISSSIWLSGCGLKLGGPPLGLSSRDSLVGAGKIVRIVNTTNEGLAALEIEITSPDGDSRSFSHPALGAYETLEVGWKKLGGWQVVEGAKVTVRVEGFLLPFSARLIEDAVPPGDAAEPDID